LYAGLSKRTLKRMMHSNMLKRCPKYYFIARSLQVTVQQILEHGRSTTVEDAIKDVQFLDQRNAIVYRRV
jgi:hypothetical protein